MEFSLSEPAEVEQVVEALHKDGVVILRGISDESLAAGRAEYDRALARDLEGSKEWKAGVVGNKMFGYLYMHPTEKPHMVDGVAVAPLSGYQANLAVITHPDNVRAMDLLYGACQALAGSDRQPMISWDSAKLRGEQLTKAHYDSYRADGTGGRLQAIAFGPGEETRLGFCVGSHKDRNYGGKVGFCTVDPALTRNYKVVFGRPGDVIAWLPGVIHFEEGKAKGSRERYVVGANIPPVDLDLDKWAVLAEHGWLPDPYRVSKQPQAVRANCFHSKSTQYYKRRKPSQHEMDRLERVKRLLDENPRCQNKRRAYGLT